MTSTTTGLPVYDVQLRILDHIAADCKSWEDSRQHLHLRLLSKSLGLHFEKALFHHIRLQVAGRSTSSLSKLNQLLRILENRTSLANLVKVLCIEDDYYWLEEAFEGQTQVQIAFESPARLSYVKTVAQECARLVAICTQITVLDLQAADALGSKTPIFSKQIAPSHGKLRHVVLRDDAFARHICSYLSANLSQTSLKLASGHGVVSTAGKLPLHSLADFQLKKTIEEANPQPLTLDTLYISTATSSLWVLGARDNVKPHLVRIAISSYRVDSPAKFVWQLRKYTWLKAAEEVCFESLEGDTPGPEFSVVVERLMAEGLRVRCE